MAETKVEEKKPDSVQAEESGKKLVLSQSMMDTCVYQVKEHYRQAGKSLECAILDQKIQVSDSGVMTLQVTGSIQEEIANKMRPDLVGLIRQLTGAGQLSVQVVQAEEVQDDRPKLYTNTDKLNYLKQKHPALAELQRKFGLDVDF